jgi:cytoskeletal protein RodZ
MKKLAIVLAIALAFGVGYLFCYTSNAETLNPVTVAYAATESVAESSDAEIETVSESDEAEIQPEAEEIVSEEIVSEEIVSEIVETETETEQEVTETVVTETVAPTAQQTVQAAVKEETKVQETQQETETTSTATATASANSAVYTYVEIDPSQFTGKIEEGVVEEDTTPVANVVRDYMSSSSITSEEGKTLLYFATKQNGFKVAGSAKNYCVSMSGAEIGSIYTVVTEYDTFRIVVVDNSTSGIGEFRFIADGDVSGSTLLCGSVISMTQN